MFAILKKEFNSFFASPIAYLVIGIFLLINSLFLWVFNDDLNILNAGFADLNSFFLIAPWIFLFLIPAITMKSFAEEFNSGTIETLQTKPITDWHIVLGKFLASLLLISVALLPTLTYVYTVIQLGNPVGNLDIGSTVGSYIGLFFLAATYTSIGLFTSTLSNNQIVAFIFGVFITFFFFYGFDAIASLFTNNSYTVQKFGMTEHFKSISRGVLDTRDLLYFISLSVFFLVLTKNQLRNATTFSNIVVLLIGILVINAIGSRFYERFDITKDKRYTVTETTKSIVSLLDKRTLIKVYLKGDFPAEFKRLQIEAQQFLEELRAINSNISIQFINPNTFREALIKKGMIPSRLTVEENGTLTEAIIFPWAEISYQNNTKIVSLLPNTVSYSQEEQLKNAIESLEFSFASSLKSIRQKNKQKIAIITGNGELQDIYIYSLLKEVSKKYHLAKFTLDSVANNPQKTLKELTSFDLAIIAKPTERFSDKEKLVLDQFIIHGGKTLWMLDNVQADQDSLLSNGKMLSYPRDLNVTDLLFSYGVRVNSRLVKDLYAAKISLATGNIGNQPQFQSLPWFFHPLANGNQQHVISKNIKPVRLQFATQIDTLKNGIKKTPLLVSSLLTTTLGTPAIVALKSIAEQADEKVYNKGHQLFAVLLEGNFNSAYKNRIRPFETPLFKTTSKATKMVVISDGDIAKNQLLKGQPFDLSIDKWTQESFGNKEFLINTIDYLLDEDGLINLRNKSLNIQLLDKQKAYQERTFWQLFNSVSPLLLLLGFGIVFNFLRKRKYQ